jgi:hypothetical protein
VGVYTTKLFIKNIVQKREIRGIIWTLNETKPQAHVEFSDHLHHEVICKNIVQKRKIRGIMKDTDK